MKITTNESRLLKLVLEERFREITGEIILNAFNNSSKPANLGKQKKKIEVKIARATKAFEKSVKRIKKSLTEDKDSDDEE